jgi:hypothetical protein
MSIKTNIPDVRNFIRQWFELILNDTDEMDLDIPVIYSRQDGPAPSKIDKYIVIGRLPSRVNEGQADRTKVIGATEEDEGHVDHFYDYEDTWQITEYNGEGDLIRVVLESYDRQDIRDLFKVAGLAYRGLAGDVISVPEEIEKHWYIRAEAEIRVGLRSHVQYTPGLIETVDYSGNIGGIDI